MDFTVNNQDGRSVIAAQGDIVSTNVEGMVELLTKQIAAGERFLILDFTKATLIDSAGISSIVGIIPQLRAAKAKLVLGGCNATVRKVFQLVGFNQHFTITATLSEALALPA